MDENERLRRKIDSIKNDLNAINQALIGNIYSRTEAFYQEQWSYTEADLNNAVECENYELAAIIRDELNKNKKLNKATSA